MNRSLLEIGGGILLVSQFTLHASTRKGNRPSFIGAARPEVAVPLYESFIFELTGQPRKIDDFVELMRRIGHLSQVGGVSLLVLTRHVLNIRRWRQGEEPPLRK